MFTPVERDRVRDRILEIATADDRVVAAAVVGSLARGGGDRWSDIDLSFAVRDDVAIAEVLDDWTSQVTEDLGAIRLLDLVVAPLLASPAACAGFRRATGKATTDSRKTSWQPSPGRWHLRSSHASWPGP